MKRMALIRCPACQTEVSRQAVACPKCGQPIRRGFLGRGPIERAINILVLGGLIFVAFMVLLYVFR